MNQIVHFFEKKFASVNSNPRRTAEELIAHVLDCKPLEIYLHNGPLSEKARISLEKLAARIENGEPLQYVIGHVDFRGLKIKCDLRALIPRPETEQLVEEVLLSKVWKKSTPDIADIGTGTGCIVLALAAERPNARYTAVDISKETLGLARENACFHGLGKKIRWMVNSLLDGFAPNSLDAVVANLPYIASADWEKLDPSVRNYEPQSALNSGPTGLELIERLANQATDVLRPGGMLFLEFGFNQAKAVSRCLKKEGYTSIQIKPDCAGHDRIATAEVPY